MVIEGLPVGSVFAFLWNVLVSVSFQFVGFLLTYLLHNSHASKYGSRAGLGVTLIQYGFALRDETLPVADDDGAYWGWSDPNVPQDNPATGGTVTRRVASAVVKRAIPLIARVVTVYNNGTASTPETVGTKGPFTTSIDNPNSPTSSLPSSTSSSSFSPNDWLSFMLMTLGWFLLITSFLGYWRVKRWERGVQRSVESTAEREREREPREPSPEDLARNAQVLRNLEQAFGIQWDTARPTPGAAAAAAGSVVSPTTQPISARGTERPPPADGGLFGLSAALSSHPSATVPPTAGGAAGALANPGAQTDAEGVEHTNRHGTRRLFRMAF